MGYEEYWDKIRKVNKQLDEITSSYWQHYSSFGDWQFWVVVASMILPLLLLYFTIDRKRIFEIFVFGYTVHILWAYTDSALQNNNLTFHTYFLTALLPNALNITASLLPVGFLLVYQYCTNHNKNFYVYTAILSAFFSFGLASIEKALGMLELRNGMHLFYFFLIDIGIAYISYWFLKLLKKFKST